MDKLNVKVFVCFPQKDRYTIAEPIVHHLRNYGIEVWYDRNELLMGDNRVQKNLIEGASKCAYAIPILSANSENAPCFLEEMAIIKHQFKRGNMTVFPVLYELAPNQIPCKLQWINKLIFKEVDQKSGTREICNHVACRITRDILKSLKYKRIQDVINDPVCNITTITRTLLESYQKIDTENLNSRVSMLYATYISLVVERNIQTSKNIKMAEKMFERLFSETKLNIRIDYRDLWLLENSTCILINNYLLS